MVLKKLLSILMVFFSSGLCAAPSSSSSEYKEVYTCATESFESDYGGGPAAFCIGNSRDPSKIEERAYKDAKRDFLSKKNSTTSSGSCTFKYAIWVGNGSRADGFEEGTVKEVSLRKIAQLLPSRENRITFFYLHGQVISGELASKLFFVTKKDQYGMHEYKLSDFAKKNCTKKQIG